MCEISIIWNQFQNISIGRTKYIAQKIEGRQIKNIISFNLAKLSHTKNRKNIIKWTRILVIILQTCVFNCEIAWCNLFLFGAINISASKLFLFFPLPCNNLCSWYLKMLFYALEIGTGIFFTTFTYEMFSFMTKMRNITFLSIKTC